MWPIIKKAVNSDLSTPLNVPINAIKVKTDLIPQIKSKTDLIASKCQLFLANGTFVVPAGVYTVYLTGCAAGNMGTAGASGAGGAGGDGGAGGEVIFDFLIPNLTPGQSIAVTTGNGNTVFGSHLTLVKGGGTPGGSGGQSGQIGAYTAGSPGGKGGGSLIKGTPYNGGAGGAGGAAGGGSGGGGGGGGFSGAGGAGGDAGVNYGAGSPGVIGTGYGSGGGGGGGTASNIGGAGGAGRPGFLFVRWL